VFFEVPIRFELTNKSFADSPLKPLGYGTVSFNFDESPELPSPSGWYNTAPAAKSMALKTPM